MATDRSQRMALDFGEAAGAPPVARAAWSPRPAGELVGRTVVSLQREGSASSHDAISRQNVARRLAAFLGCRFKDAPEAAESGMALYLVPDDAMLAGEAARLGVLAPADLFGGVVPHAFVATKSIVHPLGVPDAMAPAGWSAGFATAVRPVVLDGETAFSRADAVSSIVRMLRGGPVRVKRATGVGGRGQFVVRSVEEGQAALASVDERELATFGVVIEENLRDVVTFSVGQVEVGGCRASYWGTQRTTRNHQGHEVYGGSSLHVARGDFADLLALALPDDARRAVELSWCFDAAAFAHYPGLMASRRNYDVARGLDADGQIRIGVLEQSWRIGGASAAEVLALEALRARPSCRDVRASTVETYGGPSMPPEGAFVYYDGEDSRVGRLSKYATVEGDADA